ncbi:MAG TPA: tetratricopeptide repeat protein [Burkholderiales bacterium]|nr:tetratricopeptide repeat protein [Burkholderiales bacterium]
MKILTFRSVILCAALAAAPFAVAQGDEYQEASQLFKQGQYAPALDHIANILKDDPKNARARFLKGLIENEQGKPADAIKTFQSLNEDYPELPEPYNNLAVLYAAQGDYDKAREALEMAIRTHPSYATAHENLGDIYAKMASQAYDKALQYDKGNTSAQTKLALIKELFSTPPAAARPQTGSAEKPVLAQVPAQVQGKPAAAANRSGEVIRTVNNWARAWSQNDVDGYLAFYAPGFQTPQGQSHDDWENSRKARIAKPKKIEVTISSPQVRFTDDNRVVVTFRQDYRSTGLKSSTTKTLVLIRDGERWLIQQERAGS